MTADELFSIAAKHKGVFTEPPHCVPAGDVDVSGGGRWRIWKDAGTRIDAPIFGNGDLIAAFAGPREYPQIWFTTNDFWQMESAANYEFFQDNETAKRDPAVCLGGPRPVGRFIFDLPELKDTDYRVEQDYANAVTTAVYSRDGREMLRIEMWAAATENELFAAFTAQQDLEFGFEFRFPDEPGKGCETWADIDGLCEEEEIRNGMYTGLVGGRATETCRNRGGLIEGMRAFEDHVDVPTRIGFCGGFPWEQMKNGRAALKAGQTETFVLSVRSWNKVSRPCAIARSGTRRMTREDMEALKAAHKKWWRDFWSVSGVSFGDEVIEKRYYLSQYMMASVSRDPDYPPNILGISTFDRPAWNGNYKINYNHQTPYLGLLVSGHFEQADPHDAPYLSMLELAREMGPRLQGHPGAYYPLGLGPKGMVSEALLLGMKSPGVHGAINMITRWELTMDEVYAKRVYPFLRSIADFWEYDLVERDSVMHIVGDGMHERTTADIAANGVPEDPVNTLGYLHTFFDGMIRISKALEADSDRRAKWAEILQKLAPYPMGTVREITDNPTLWKEADAKLADLIPEELLDSVIFYDEGKGGKWSHHFPGNVMQIYPANAVGRGSPEELRRAAWNTVHIHALAEDALAKRSLHAGEAAKSITEGTGIPGDDPHFYKAGAWNADNLSCLFFPAAVRADYDPEIIWHELRGRITVRGIENGYFKRNPHGIEQLSTVPNTVQEMMLQSHEHIIRVFPNWPRRKLQDAEFTNLRAYGAFKVSACLKNGTVDRVTIESLKGTAGRAENPWPGEEVILTERYGPIERTSAVKGDVIELPAYAGIYTLRRNVPNK